MPTAAATPKGAFVFYMRVELKGAQCGRLPTLLLNIATGRPSPSRLHHFAIVAVDASLR